MGSHIHEVAALHQELTETTIQKPLEIKVTMQKPPGLNSNHLSAPSKSPESNCKHLEATKKQQAPSRCL